MIKSNAAVKAARAGTAGKGFAVIAAKAVTDAVNMIPVATADQSQSIRDFTGGIQQIN